jgi:hypothetical protein
MGIHAVREFTIYPTFIEWLLTDGQDDNAEFWQIADVSVVTRPGLIGELTLLAVEFHDGQAIELDLGNKSHEAKRIIEEFTN